MTKRPSPSAERPQGAAIVTGVRAGAIEVARVMIAAGARLPQLELDEIEALLVVSGRLVIHSPGRAATALDEGRGLARRLNDPMHLSAAADSEVMTARASESPAMDGGAGHRGAPWHPLSTAGVDALRQLHRAVSTSTPNARLAEGLAMVAIAWAESALTDGKSVVDPPQWMHRVTESLRDISERPTLDDLARKAGVTSTHLTRVFRQFEGCTIGEYHRRMRIAAACRLMQDDELPLSAIATATGFADHAHLSKVFRRATGFSPREYRRAVAREPGGSPAAAPFFEPSGRYTFRSRTAHGTPYDGVFVINRVGNTYRGFVRTTVMPDVPIESIAIHDRRMVLTAHVPAGVAILDLRFRGAEFDGEWRLAGTGTALRGRRSV